MKTTIAERIAGFRYWLACRISPWVADVEHRFSCVLDDVTNSMSKTNYTLDAMRSEIQAKRMQDDEDAIDDFLSDYDDDKILERAANVRELARLRREQRERARPSKL